MKIPEEWPTREMILAGNAVSPNRNVVAIFNAMFAAAPIPPVQEDEPVAMVYHHKSGAGIGGMRWKHLPHGTNLYTHPADDKLRKAAEDARRLLKVFLFCEQEAISREEIEGGKVVLKQLRAALEGK